MLTATRELHDPVVSIRPNPHEVIVVNKKAVRVPREFGYILCVWIPPCLHHLSLSIKLDYYRSGDTTQPRRWILDGTGLLLSQRLPEMGYPDVVLCIDEN